MPVTDKDLERYATIRAGIDLGTPKEAVLREHGETLEKWTAFEATVLEEVADDIDRGETARLLVFQRAYDARVGPRPVPEPAAEPIVEGTAPAPAAPAGLPSKQFIEASNATEMVDGSAIRAALVKGGVPFESSGAPAPRIAPAAAVVRGGPTMLPNQGVVEALLDRGALPFSGDARAPTAPARPAEPVIQSGATVAPNADVLKSLLARGAVPFGSAPTPPAAPPPAPALSPSPMRTPMPQIHSGDMARTEQLPSGAEIEAAVALVKARQQEQRMAELASRSTAAPRADAGKAPALPFGAQPQQPQPNHGLMPLEKYAEITAALEKEGNPMKTFERIGATPESWMALVLAYSKQFAKDKALEAQFEALMKKHRGGKGNAR